MKLSEMNNPLIKIKIGTAGIELKLRKLSTLKISEQCWKTTKEANINRIKSNSLYILNLSEILKILLYIV